MRHIHENTIYYVSVNKYGYKLYAFLSIAMQWNVRITIRMEWRSQVNKIMCIGYENIVCLVEFLEGS